MQDEKNIRIKHIIYTSRPLDSDNSDIENILISSERNNPKSEVTGLLIFGSKLYLQFLEGPENSVDATFNRIKKDKRHNEIRILKESKSDRRLFASWTMRPQDLELMMWTAEDIESGLVEKFNSKQALNVFENLSREFDQFLNPNK
tara:strand:- start:30 stop:467 length:438 start_codon:yes stop_codon:yes gene_type:complete